RTLRCVGNVEIESAEPASSGSEGAIRLAPFLNVPSQSAPAPSTAMAYTLASSMPLGAKVAQALLLGSYRLTPWDVPDHAAPAISTAMACTLSSARPSFSVKVVHLSLLGSYRLSPSLRNVPNQTAPVLSTAMACTACVPKDRSSCSSVKVFQAPFLG